MVVVDGIMEWFCCGGCLIYIGVGMVGCIGVFDVSECLFMFGIDFLMVVGLIVGGEIVIWFVVENVEDDVEVVGVLLWEFDFVENDMVVGIFVFGCMLYVIGGLEYVCCVGVFMVVIVLNVDLVIGVVVDILIEVVMGLEFIFGFIWLKVGMV